VKENLPDVDYKYVNKRKRVTNKKVNCGEACNAQEKFQVKLFIPIMDTLTITFKKRAIIYYNFSKIFTLLVDLEALEKQSCEGVNILMED
jgi:hypothetical protein